MLLVVDVELGQAGVDHRGDPVDGHAGLGDVGGHDHLALAGEVVEHPLLLLGGQAASTAAGSRQPAGGGQGFQAGHAVLDRLLAGQEDEDVAPGGRVRPSVPPVPVGGPPPLRTPCAPRSPRSCPAGLGLPIWRRSS